MTSDPHQPSTDLAIPLPDGSAVSGLLTAPPTPRACYVMAHGAGAGMTHPFMHAVARGLQARDIAMLRFQFPSMQNGTRRPDRPAVAHAAIRAAVDCAGRALPGLPLFAGGKSFGGRMTSQAQAERPLPDVAGLVFFGFPLHPPKRPGTGRAAHLSAVAIPMLFLQGTRDALAEIGLLQDVVAQLGPRATLHELSGADHGFQTLRKSGRTSDQVLDDALDTMAAWIGTAPSIR